MQRCRSSGDWKASETSVLGIFKGCFTTLQILALEDSQSDNSTIYILFLLYPAEQCNMLLRFEVLNATEAGVDLAGADGSTDEDDGPFPEVLGNMGSGINHEPARCDRIFGELMCKLAAQAIFIW